jgi:hypothetical protein
MTGKAADAAIYIDEISTGSEDRCSRGAHDGDGPRDGGRRTDQRVDGFLANRSLDEDSKPQ